MPLTTAERATLDQAAAAATQAQQVVAGLVAALVADPDPNPLQVALDAMTAERNALQAKIDASKAALQASVTADAAEDAARNAALQALE